MKKVYQYNPFIYFFFTLLVTWSFLFPAAIVSRSGEVHNYRFLLFLPGLMAPFLVALIMIYSSGSPALKSDFQRRLFGFQNVKPVYWAIILIFMPVVFFSATALSLFFDQPLKQFNLSTEFSGSISTIFISIIAILLAPIFEEIGWRGYGMDSLHNNRTSVLTASIIFALLWNLWHLPLFFIKGYYQYQLTQIHFIYVLNFVFSLFPTAIIMNWIYYRTGRSIPAMIVTHAMINLYPVSFQTEQFTKIIITILFTCMAIFIVWREKELFFQKAPVRPKPFSELNTPTSHEIHKKGSRNPV